MGNCFKSCSKYGEESPTDANDLKNVAASAAVGVVKGAKNAGDAGISEVKQGNIAGAAVAAGSSITDSAVDSAMNTAEKVITEL